METTAVRLAQAMELRGMKQVELCEKTGIGKSSISTYLSGDYLPKQGNLYKIACALNVSEAWLMGYDVPMERQPDRLGELSDLDLELIDLLRRVPPDQEQRVMDFVRGLLASRKE